MVLRLLFILICLSACNRNSGNPSNDSAQETGPATKVLAPSDSVAVNASQNQTGPKVYITHEGDKYHTADCRYSKDAQAVSLVQAKADGKTACGICKPNSSTGEKQKRCTGITKEGKQCHRMTSNSNGKCYQHQSL